MRLCLLIRLPPKATPCEQILQRGDGVCIDVKASAFPPSVFSDAFGASPKNLSPASSVDGTVSSLTEDERELPNAQEWILPGLGETLKPHTVEGHPVSDGDGTLMESDADMTLDDGKEDPLPSPEQTLPTPPLTTGTLS